MITEAPRQGISPVMRLDLPDHSSGFDREDTRWPIAF
jgi:hypothetical protein